MILRGVAQLGRALGSGLRGRKFKSCHPDFGAHQRIKSAEHFLLFEYGNYCEVTNQIRCWDIRSVMNWKIYKRGSIYT